MKYQQLIAHNRVLGWSDDDGNVIYSWSDDNTPDRIATNDIELSKRLFPGVALQHTSREWLPAEAKAIALSAVSWKTKEGGSGCCSYDSFYQVCGRITIGSQCHHYYFSTLEQWAKEQLNNTDDTTTARFAVSDDVGDESRELIRRLVPYLPAQADAKEDTRLMWERIDTKLKESAHVERGILNELQDECADRADEVTADNCLSVGPSGRRPIRLKSRGWTVLIEDNFEHVARKHGAKILGCAPAKTAGYVGSSSCPMEEIVFEFEGVRWFCYRLSTSMIDSFCEECWTTDRRLTAHAAADTLLAARQLQNAS